MESFLKAMNILPTFSSNSTPRILWDICVMTLLMLRILFYTIERCFVVSLVLNKLDYGLMAIFFVDVGIKLNTKFYLSGNQITEREKIIKHFIQKKFFKEILPITLFTAARLLKLNESLIDIDLMLCLKFIASREVLSKIKDVLSINELLDSLFDLLILVIKILIWAHTIACLWHYIGFTISKESNWLRAKGIINEQWNVRYLYSIYWGVTTMLTVGYGDIAPTNQTEIFFNILAMVTGCGLFGYTMNRIGEILKNYGMHKSIRREAMTRVTKVLKRKGLPPETVMKVKKYLEFVWEREREEDTDFEKIILSKLTSNLKKEVCFQTNVKYLQSVPPFRCFSIETLLALGNCMKQVRFSPEENVYKQGDTKDFSLFFVVEGTLEMVCNNNDYRGECFPIKQFKKDGYFGIEEVFTGQARSTGIVATDFCTLFQLSREQLVQTLKRFPSDFEKYSQMKDQNLLYGCRDFYSINCDCCGFQDHNIVDCPTIKYVPDKSKLVYQHIQKKKNRKKKFKRKLAFKYNSLKMISEYQNLLEEFLSNYYEDSDLNELSDKYQTIVLSSNEIKEGSSSIQHRPELDRSSFLFKRQPSERSLKRQPTERSLRRQPSERVTSRKNSDFEKSVSLFSKNNQGSEQTSGVNLDEFDQNEGEEIVLEKETEAPIMAADKPKAFNPSWNKEVKFGSVKVQQSPMPETRNSPRNSLHFAKIVPKFEERPSMESIKSWRFYFEKGNFEIVIRKYRALARHKSYRNNITANMTLME